MNRTGLLASALALIGVGWAGASRAEPSDGRLRLDYSVYGSGLRAVAASLALDLKADRYAMELTARTDGSIGFFFPWQSAMRTQGRTGVLDLRPRAHELTSVSRGDKSSTFLDYDENGGFIARRVVPPERDEDEPVSGSVSGGAVDILSAMLELMRRLGAGQSCNQTIAVFDGRRRYDLAAVDQGKEMLQRNGYSGFAGPAVKCAIAVKPIAGAWKKRQRRWVEADHKGTANPVLAKAWFAPLTPSNAFPAPVRIELATPFGEFVVHLTRFE